MLEPRALGACADPDPAIEVLAGKAQALLAAAGLAAQPGERHANALGDVVVRVRNNLPNEPISTMSPKKKRPKALSRSLRIAAPKHHFEAITRTISRHLLE